ncbi:NADH:ubiquinone reductase (H+-translocating) [Jeotgalibacillus alimentarius]|uniref:NADH:ubiquinone reductase (H+-translocating) n=1 Tax=Jeotgalibacillus alimentarius TaxID=135826 RepID=A0A0C2RT74_9BACL|nr:HD family phosphohydrolase [Jeotgalibacillus alimentarius]KIL53435.1 NADH:ubiquinone reductase (H+-translocating) [Jeotgalibacillus alimentarius]
MKNWIHKIKNLLNYTFFKWLLLSIVGLASFLLLFSHVSPDTYNTRLFSVADETIRSPKTITDERLSEAEMERAASEVEEVYQYRPEIMNNRTSLVSSIFEFAQEYNVSTEDEEPQSGQAVTGDMLEQLKNALSEDVSEDVTGSIDDETFNRLLAASDQGLEDAKGITIDQVERVMQDPFKQEEAAAKQEEAAEYIAQFSMSDDLKEAAMDLARFAVVENNIYDPEQTEARVAQAIESVEPVQILEGQVIVQKGYLIDRDVYRQLEALGLTTSETSFEPYIGLTLFSLLIVLILYFHFSTWKISEDTKRLYLVLVSIIFLLSLGLMKAAELIRELEVLQVGYLFPAAMAPMLLKSMINTRVALIIAMLQAFCASIIFNDMMTGSVNVDVSLYFLFSGLAGILFLSDHRRRTHLLRAGLFVSAANMIFLFAVTLIESGSFSAMDYTLFAVFAVISGVLSSILTIGLLPLFESGFGILSTMKLVELSNPNHPLLKKILTEAPGTYHHSVMVANLAEAGCEAIGANGLLARVGCYYHDIGKTKRPHYFIENQISGYNPHDHLDPQTSRDIIISHAKDGADMLRKHKMPAEFIDIAEQHHGTTLLKFFYFKAKEKGLEPDEESYRYAGPKPRTKEAAVISVADSVEAAVRSMKDPTSEKIKKLVDSIIKDRLQDGQFNECDITLKQLETLKKVFCETLNGIFHSRIEYPEFKKEERKKEA